MMMASRFAFSFFISVCRLTPLFELQFKLGLLVHFSIFQLLSSSVSEPLINILLAIGYAQVKVLS
jgi:hypothetical protein